MTENLPPNERPASAARSTNPALWIGLALLVFGTVKLMETFGLRLNFGLNLGFNWWALFMLIPGAIILKNAYDAYQASGQQFTHATRSQLVAGGLLVVLGIVFLLGLSLSNLWPVFLIVGGVAILFSALNR